MTSKDETAYNQNQYEYRLSFINNSDDEVFTTSPDNSAAVKHTKSNKNKKEKPIKISLPNSEPGYDKDKNIIKRIDLDDGGTTIKEKKIITYHQLNKSF